MNQWMYLKEICVDERLFVQQCIFFIEMKCTSRRQDIIHDILKVLTRLGTYWLGR